jgi:uncharacterized protein (DUF2141 family)
MRRLSTISLFAALALLAAGAAEARKAGSDVTVHAPGTRATAKAGKVRVDAPYTAVRVDVDAGYVRVRAPFTNVFVRW